LAKSRIEKETDPKTGKIYAELYYPGDADEPLAKTEQSFQIGKLQNKK
jgi:hypothetical protein